MRERERVLILCCCLQMGKKKHENLIIFMLNNHIYKLIICETDAVRSDDECFRRLLAEVSPHMDVCPKLQK